MKLSDGEKLIILMLSELYENLGVEGEIDPDFIKSAIFNDQLWGIKWKYSGIPFEQTEDPSIVKEVVDILDMWSFIEHAYSKLNDEQKAKLEVDAEPFRKDPKFNGFDGNNEAEYMGTAMFLVNELDRFQEFKGRSFNSHCPSIETHRRMLDAFRPIRNNLVNGTMSLGQLTKVLKEKT
ncbi:MAG: YfbU family protein [Candidatus Zhuqueibacterota bacterium]